MTRPGIEPRSPGPLANTLTARPMSGDYIYYIYTILLLFHFSDKLFSLRKTLSS